ncbi:methyltransferase family protein [Stackebrandtia endophytica]|uniref:Methyltransferase family protein n=1 Tax=Stackebrandtia endophytica TaxID=1496996 RepID=A0A543APU1_9ACTN|nr:class I SAM-dependent methyltransferase [Stackebrandtia endophytica]TQL74598.1 methyltransferase family protein [Stackebrandtia endophytica]
MTFRYDDVLNPLRTAYDTDASSRDAGDKQPWKLAERQAFGDRLTTGARLLEIGAGTGHDSTYFQQRGTAVVATDLSADMVARCRAKGLDAHVMDFLNLNFPAGSFDAVYALNCLLHVPNRDFPTVLSRIAGVLRPGGLFFLGVYGGTENSEGPLTDDVLVPARFFSWRTDDRLQALATDAGFTIVDFHTVDVGSGHRFQSLTLRR